MLHSALDELLKQHFIASTTIMKMIGIRSEDDRGSSCYAENPQESEKMR